MIEESDEWYYMPMLSVPALTGMGGKWLGYSGEYSSWASINGVTALDAPNVTVAGASNAWAEAFEDGPDLNLDNVYTKVSDVPFEFALSIAFTLAPLSSTMEDPQGKAIAMASGVIRWQQYRVMLAMQALKLGLFGRRGRRADV